MESVGSFYSDLMVNRSDPRVRHWKFMGGPGPTLYTIAGYLVLVLWVLPAYMRNKKPFELTNIIRVYNIGQVLACCVLTYMFISTGWLQGDYSFGCQPIDFSNNQKAVQTVSAFWWLYVLKQVDMLDTVFFLLRKKFNQVSALHIYHHASSLFIAFIACKFTGGGMFSLPVMMNLVIHVIMYTYYYLSSLGPEWQKKLAVWKPRLTMAQMIQFTLVLAHSLTAFQPGCEVPKLFFAIYSPNVVIIYKMFYDFYKKSYKSKSTKIN